MSDVVEWLEARLAEVEAAARAAFGASWSLDEIADVWREDFDGQPHLVARRLTEADAAHVALNDPAAVLRSVAGARAVMGLHTTHAGHGFCDICSTWDDRLDAWDEPYPCPTLRALATGWGWDECRLEPRRAQPGRGEPGEARSEATSTGGLHGLPTTGLGRRR